MTVTHVFGADQTIVASNLNDNFNDILSALSSINNSQLAGGITRDKLAQNKSLSITQKCAVPFTSGADLGSPAGFVAPASYAEIAPRFFPIVESNTSAFLVAIVVHVMNADTGGSDYAKMRFRLNNTTVIVGEFDIDQDDHVIILSYGTDPVADPLITLSNGDYITTEMVKVSATAPEVSGVDTAFVIKHVHVG